MNRARRNSASVQANVFAQLRGALIWEDDFDGAAGDLVDGAKWNYESGMLRNNELQYYKAADADNAAMDGNGNLVISVLQESFGGAAYTSASLLTQGKFDFLYGYIEARIRTPTGSGVWPAFWLEGATSNWPIHGEIDVMEKINSEAGSHFTVHAGPTHWQSSHYHAALPRDDNYHLYAARVSPGKVEFYLDNSLVYTVTTANVPNGQQWPFDTYPQFIRLNVAMGGDWPGAPNGSAALPLSMYVDYVRVYSLS